MSKKTRGKGTAKSSSVGNDAGNGRNFLIVGVGASAGGMEAFQELLTALGNAPGVAIVFVQHLDPNNELLLGELLQRHTPLEFATLKNRVRLEPRKVYVCPTQRHAEVRNGAFRVTRTDDEQRPSNAIDHLFHSLADDQGDRAVGVILSGAGSDGTLGLKAISDRGGLTFAQEAASAKFDGMPRIAAITGVADHVLTPAQIAVELLQYQQHVAEISDNSYHKRLQVQIEEAVPAIAETLLKLTNHNFQHCKINTPVRRIQRRMQGLEFAHASDYVAYLQNVKGEAQLLFRELLIVVDQDRSRGFDSIDFRKVLPR